MQRRDAGHGDRRLGRRRGDEPAGRADVRRAGDDLPARGRRVRVHPPGLRPALGLPLRLDPLLRRDGRCPGRPGDGPGDLPQRAVGRCHRRRAVRGAWPGTGQRHRAGGHRRGLDRDAGQLRRHLDRGTRGVRADGTQAAAGDRRRCRRVPARRRFVGALRPERRSRHLRGRGRGGARRHGRHRRGHDGGALGLQRVERGDLRRGRDQGSGARAAAGDHRRHPDGGRPVRHGQRRLLLRVATGRDCERGRVLARGHGRRDAVSRAGGDGPDERAAGRLGDDGAADRGARGRPHPVRDGAGRRLLPRPRPVEPAHPRTGAGPGRPGRVGVGARGLWLVRHADRLRDLRRAHLHGARDGVRLHLPPPAAGRGAAVPHLGLPRGADPVPADGHLADCEHPADQPSPGLLGPRPGRARRALLLVVDTGECRDAECRECRQCRRRQSVGPAATALRRRPARRAGPTFRIPLPPDDAVPAVCVELRGGDHPAAVVGSAARGGGRPSWDVGPAGRGRDGRQRARRVHDLRAGPPRHHGRTGAVAARGPRRAPAGPLRPASPAVVVGAAGRRRDRRAGRRRAHAPHADGRLDDCRQARALRRRRAAREWALTTSVRARHRHSPAGRSRGCTLPQRSARPATGRRSQYRTGSSPGSPC